MVDEVKDTTVEAGVDESGAGDDAFHMPETWTEMCEGEPLFVLLPELVPAERLKFRQAAELRKLSGMAGFTLREGTTGPVEASMRDVESKIDERMDFVERALDWVKSLTSQPEKVDEWTLGIGLDELFWLVESILLFYTDQLGKSLDSKRRSASTPSN